MPLSYFSRISFRGFLWELSSGIVDPWYFPLRRGVLYPCSLEPSPYKLFRSSMFLLIEVTFFLNFGRFTLKKMECSKQAFFFATEHISME